MLANIAVENGSWSDIMREVQEQSWKWLQNGKNCRCCKENTTLLTQTPGAELCCNGFTRFDSKCICRKNDMSIKIKVMRPGQISRAADTTLKQNLLSTLGNYEFNGRAFFICKVHRRSGNCQEHNVLEIAQRLMICLN